MRPSDRIQAQHVTAFSRLMSRKYDSQVFDKNVHDAVAAAVDFAKRIGVIDASAYLKTYAFTLGTMIWYPFDVERPKEEGDWTFANQLVTIAHEHVHVRQFRAHRGVPFASDYVLSAEARAMRWEAEAFGTLVEVWPTLFAGTPMPTPEWVVAPLHAYGCTPEQVQGAAEVVRARMVTVQRGGTITPEARELLDFLKSAQISG